MNGASGAAPAMAAGAPQPSLARLLIKHMIMAAILAAVLIGGSGRTGWLRAYTYIAAVSAVQILAGALLVRRAPELLVERSRMQQGTKSWDKVLAPIIALVGPLAMWGAAAWDVRAHWPPALPVVWSAAALVICAAGGLLTLFAMLENRFFSATVRIQSERGQVVVDSGPYRYVRHPGYTGALAFTVTSPLALGSWLSMIPAVVTALVLVLRIVLEERTLRTELPGYAEYTLRTRFRLVPGLW